MYSFTQDSTQGGIDELNWTREPGTLSSNEEHFVLITLEMWQQRRSKVTFTSCGYLDIFCEKTFLQRKVFFSITRRRDLTVKLFWDVNHLLSCLRIYWASNSLIERVNALSSKFLSCSHCTLRVFLLGKVVFVYHASTKGLREIKIVFCSVEVSTENLFLRFCWKQLANVQ